MPTPSCLRPARPEDAPPSTLALPDPKTLLLTPVTAVSSAPAASKALRSGQRPLLRTLAPAATSLRSRVSPLRGRDPKPAGPLVRQPSRRASHSGVGLPGHRCSSGC